MAKTAGLFKSQQTPCRDVIICPVAASNSRGATSSLPLRDLVTRSLPTAEITDCPLTKGVVTKTLPSDEFTIKARLADGTRYEIRAMRGVQGDPKNPPVVVATMTRSTVRARRARSTTRASMGAPAMSASTLPGSRVDAVRA